MSIIKNRGGRIMILMLLAVTIVMTGCDNKDEADSAESHWTHLVSYEKVGTLTAAEARTSFGEIYPTVDNAGMTEDVDYYKIVYKSTYLGRTVELSGLVLLPSGARSKGALEQVQYQHGTLFPTDRGDNTGEDQTDAPSLFDQKKDIIDYDFFEVRAFGLNFASRGYFISLPDYSGYGVSQDALIHLYDCNRDLAGESYDMLVASREMAQDLSVELQSGVSLCGWSEGAVVSLYLQKLVEDEGELNVKVNTCLAGAYVPSKVIQEVGSIPAGNIMIIYAGWFVLTHCVQQGISPSTFLNDSITDFSDLIAVYDKSPTINAMFNKSTIEDNFEKMSTIADASNVAVGWIPKGNVHLFHGEKDENVPYSQSVFAMEEFEKSSVPAGRVTLHTYPEGDHESFSDDYITKTLELMK